MKTENNELEKAKYLAIYWGQNVIHNDDFIWRSNETFDTVLSIYNGDLSKWYASLKPLSDISDEDAIAIKYHGRYNYVINLNRDLVMKYEGMGKTEIKHYQDPQYYIDISVTPMISGVF